MISNTNKLVFIFPAKAEDAVLMAESITREAKDYGSMLPKSAADILTLLLNYFVAKQGEEIVGTVGLKIWPTGQVELISLWVRLDYRGSGLGKRLVETGINKACEQGFKELFALAISPEFFEKLGFKRVDFNYFQPKIWTDCLRCPKNLGNPGNPRCPELPMLLNLK